jgi:homoserine acetyltransferase
MDPRWRDGEYYDARPGDGPHEGLATARMMSMMTFRSDDVFSARFGREVVEPIDGRHPDAEAGPLARLVQPRLDRVAVHAPATRSWEWDWQSSMAASHPRRRIPSVNGP